MQEKWKGGGYFSREYTPLIKRVWCVQEKGGGGFFKKIYTSNVRVYGVCRRRGGLIFNKINTSNKACMVCAGEVGGFQW